MANLHARQVRTVREIDPQDAVSSETFAHKFPDNSPREWTKQAWKTLEEATESCMVVVKAEFHFRSSN